MHVLQPKARRRLPKEVAQQTRLKQHRRRVKALPTSWIQSTNGCPASTRGCPWSRSCTVNLKSLRESLEFSQQQVETLAAENASLRDSVKSLTENMTHLSEENKKIKENVIDLQTRSMRDNLVFSGIPESAEEDPEATVKNFIKTYLKLPEDTVENICFERVHRMGAKKPGAPRAASYCGQIRILQAERAGEESRQGAERNRLRRKRPVSPKKSWSDAKFCSQSDAVSSKRAPELSSQWIGSTWTDSSTATSVPLRGYINTTPDKNPLYLSFFFLSFLACSSIYL